jgi:RimJ/RimL family protein N-acetyltransferase
MLHRWLAEPHLRPFYMRQDIDLAECDAKFRPRCAPGHPTKVLIGMIDNEPFGYCQWYLNRSYADWATTIGTFEGVSIDYFIGVPDKLRHGLAAPMLHALVERAAAELANEDRLFWITHDDRNHIAKRATIVAGFRAERAVVDRGKPSTLFGLWDRFHPNLLR